MAVTMRTELSDGRIRIRRYREEDAGRLFEAARESISEVHPWLPWCHPGYSREESEEWVKSRPKAWDEGEAHGFVIEDALSGEFLGGCGLNQVDKVHLRANLGYWVRTSRTGEGVATAATLLLARFAFEDLGLQRVEMVAAVENKASQRVAEKAGAGREGILRKRLNLHGKRYDAVGFSLVPEDLGQAAPSD